MIKADFIRIILWEANAENAFEPDIVGLRELMLACISGDPKEVEHFAEDHRPHVRSAANFILRKHRFELAKEAAGAGARQSKGKARPSNDHLFEKLAQEIDVSNVLHKAVLDINRECGSGQVTALVWRHGEHDRNFRRGVAIVQTESALTHRSFSVSVSETGLTLKFLGCERTLIA